jgi:hypothetical protein
MLFQVKRSESFGDWTPDGSPGSSMFASMTPADELTYTLSGLQPTTYYKVEITAKNSLGHSHPTTLVFRTADYNDGKQLSLSCSSSCKKNAFPLIFSLL